MSDDPTVEFAELEQKAIDGDNDALAELFQLHGDRLRMMIEMRLDRRVQSRINASDVLQQSFIDLADQLGNYAKNPTVPFFVWMRKLTGQRLSKVHRDHLATQKRDAHKEVRLPGAEDMPDASSVAIAKELAGSFTGPQTQLLRAERQERLQEVLVGMSDEDREILALKNFEQLTTAEAAHELGISKAAAGMRYVRALKKLQAEVESRRDEFGDTMFSVKAV